MSTSLRRRPDRSSLPATAILAFILVFFVAPTTRLSAKPTTKPTGNTTRAAQPVGAVEPSGWAYHDTDTDVYTDPTPDAHTDANTDTGVNTGPSGPTHTPDPQPVTATQPLRFRIIYRADDPASRTAAAEIAALVPTVGPAVATYLDYTPKERIPVVLRADTATANGYFTPLPPHIELFISSPSRYQLGAATPSWLQLVFTHELIHYLHLTRPQGLFGTASRLFGPLTAAGSYLFMPGWMVEGPTVHGETTLTPGGRGTDPFFEMTWLAPILEGTMYSYDQAGYAGPLPPQSRIYSAGYLMTDYIHRTYSPDTWHTMNRTFMNLPFAGMRRAIRKTTGISANQLFQNMIHEIELRSAWRRTLPAGTPVSPTDSPGSWHLIGRTSYGAIAWATHPRTPGALYLIPETIPEDETARRPNKTDGQTPQHLVTVTPTDPTSIAVDYTLTLAVAAIPVPDYTGAGARVSWSDLYLIRLQPDAGGAASPPQTTRRLTRDQQLLHPALTPDGTRLIAIQRQGSYSRLVDVSLTDGSIIPLYSPDKTYLHTPRFSPDGKLIALVHNKAGQQDILILDSTDGKPLAVIGSPDANEYDPFFAPPTPGTPTATYRLFFGSDEPGRLVLQETRLPPRNALLSAPHQTRAINTLPRYSGHTILEDQIGVFAGFPIGGDRIIYNTYRSTGYALRLDFPSSIENPVEIGKVIPSDREHSPKKPGSTQVNHDDNTSSIVSINTLPDTPYGDRLRPVFWFPVATLRGGSDVPTTTDFGLYTLAASNLERHQLEGTITYNPTWNQVSGALGYAFTPGAATWGVTASRSFTTAEKDSSHTLDYVQYKTSLSVQRPLWYTRQVGLQRGLTGALGTAYRYRDFRTADNPPDESLVAFLTAFRYFARPDTAPGLFFGAGERSVTSTVFFQPALLDRDTPDLGTTTQAQAQWWIRRSRFYLTPTVAYTARLDGNAIDDSPYRNGGFSPAGESAITDTRQTLLGRLSFSLDMGPYDVAWRGLSGSGSAVSLYLEQLAAVGQADIASGKTTKPRENPVIPDNHGVAGFELAADIYFNTVPLRLTGGIAMRLPHATDAGPQDLQFYLTLGGITTQYLPALTWSQATARTDAVLFLER